MFQVFSSSEESRATYFWRTVQKSSALFPSGFLAGWSWVCLRFLLAKLFGGILRSEAYDRQEPFTDD